MEPRPEPEKFKWKGRRWLVAPRKERRWHSALYHRIRGDGVRLLAMVASQYIAPPRPRWQTPRPLRP